MTKNTKALYRMFVSREGEILAYMQPTTGREIRGDFMRWEPQIKGTRIDNFCSPKGVPSEIAIPAPVSACCSYKNADVEIWECDFQTPSEWEMRRTFPPELFILASDVEAVTAADAIDVLCGHPEVLRVVGRYAEMRYTTQESAIAELRDYAGFLRDEDRDKARNRRNDEMITPDQIKEAARMAHEANRAYCVSLGDTSQPIWDKAPAWQRESAISGVKYILSNPGTTPQQSHDEWSKHKIASGWTYGEVKDEKAKTHPCLVPYEDLPPEQRAKDYIFAGVVRATLEINTDQTEAEDA